MRDDIDEDIKQDFARRLASARVQRGWNQSELARQAALYTPDKKFGRGLVWAYENGSSFPNDINMSAISKALHMEPEDLLPKSAPEVVPSSFPSSGVSFRTMEDDTVWLKINQRVDYDIGMQIIAMLRGKKLVDHK